MAGGLKNNPCKVILRVISVKGTCVAGHEVGQEYDLGDGLVLGRSGNGRTLCPSAFYAVYPGYRALRHGGIHPWETDEDILTVACPDPKNPVVMELMRVDEPETRFS